MSESTRERILKRRHEDLGHHGAHPGLSLIALWQTTFD